MGLIPGLDAEQAAAWERDGFFLIRGFCSPAVGEEMLNRVVELSREADGDGVVGDAVVVPENNLVGSSNETLGPETRVSKVFKLHRDPVFRNFATDPTLVSVVATILGADIDCFLSQFIFKNPGAWGQPWHQDSYYFPFDRTPQVGVWLAITAATADNGCLRVMPGSHHEPVHQHVRDKRPGANHGYVEIVDHDMSANLPVMMDPGDLLVFHSHLMHCSTDNVSDGIRGAMVYHYAVRGTVDRSKHPAPINDWMPINRPMP